MLPNHLQYQTFLISFRSSLLGYLIGAIALIACFRGTFNKELGERDGCSGKPTPLFSLLFFVLLWQYKWDPAPAGREVCSVEPVYNIFFVVWSDVISMFFSRKWKSWFQGQVQIIFTLFSFTVHHSGSYVVSSKIQSPICIQ